MARDLVHELDGLAIGMAANSLARNTVSDAAREIERLRRVRDELLIYINGIAKNSAKVVETMQAVTDNN